MARRPRLTQEKLDALRADYEAWNPYSPDAISANELAAKHGVSKNTMYMWRSRGWRLDGREGQGPQGWKDRGGPAQEPTQDLSTAVLYLTDELVRARIRIDELERQLDTSRLDAMAEED